MSYLALNTHIGQTIIFRMHHHLKKHTHKGESKDKDSTNRHTNWLGSWHGNKNNKSLLNATHFLYQVVLLTKNSNQSSLFKTSETASRISINHNITSTGGIKIKTDVKLLREGKVFFSQENNSSCYITLKVKLYSSVYRIIVQVMLFNVYFITVQ